jgi:hypothetical protein
MPLVVKDRVKETTTTTGTGTITLAGAATGYQSFSAIGNGNTTYYCIAGQTTSEWEVGIGTYTSAGTTLSRTTVLASSNAGSLVTFSAGTKDVFVTYPSGRAVLVDGTTIATYGMSATQGDIIYASATDTFSRLAKDATATRYLSNTGASNNPAWAQVNLANGVTGTLPTANGGTGNTSGQAASVANAATFNNGGAGAASGTTFNGSSAVTVSYNTIGAPSTTGTNASGTWGISVTGSAGSVDYNNITNKTGGTGTYTTSGDYRAPIFYDSNNTTYYADPNSISSLYGIAIRGDQAPSDSSNQIFFWGSGNTTTSGIGFKQVTGVWAEYNTSGGYNTYLTMDTAGRGWVFRQATVGGTNWTGTNVASITNQGNAFFAGNVTAYASDQRLKTNIKKIENALEKLNKINGVEFDWVENIADYLFTPTNPHETGVLAQEVQAVIPDAVTTAPFNCEYARKSGQDHKFLTVDKEKIIPLLIEAIKELSAKVDELKKVG